MTTSDMCPFRGDISPVFVVLSNIVTEGFYIARTGLGPFGEGWEEKGEDVDWFLYNRLWAVGVFTLIESIGLEPNEEVSSCFRCRVYLVGRQTVTFTPLPHMFVETRWGESYYRQHHCWVRN